MAATPDEATEHALDGDARAEIEFARRFYGPVSLMVRSRIADREAALDVTQDVMLAVIRALRQGKLQRPERLPQYVYGTALHLVSDYFRGFKHVQPTTVDAPTSGDATPERITEQRERLGRVLDAFRGLRLVDRAILGMVVTEGLSAPEIAKQTGMKPDQVRQRKSRAIRRIRCTLPGRH